MDPETTTIPDELIPTRYSLLSRLQDWGDEESWRVFFETYWRLIYSVALKAGLTDAEAQDVVQETVINVAKKIKDFQVGSERGSFKAWLVHTTDLSWRILFQFTKESGNPISKCWCTAVGWVADLSVHYCQPVHGTASFPTNTQDGLWRDNSDYRAQ